MADKESERVVIPGSSGAGTSTRSGSYGGADNPRGLPAGSRRADGAAWVKEWIASLLAISIALLALWMLWSTFQAAREFPDLAEEAAAKRAEAHFARLKDVMLYGFSLFGAVLGYYFGRVPTERRAERAEDQLQKTQKSLTSVSSDAEIARAEMRGEKSRRLVLGQRLQSAAAVARSASQRLRSLEAAAAGAVSAQGAAPAPAEDLREVRAELDLLERDLGRDDPG